MQINTVSNNSFGAKIKINNVSGENLFGKLEKEELVRVALRHGAPTDTFTFNIGKLNKASDGSKSRLVSAQADILGKKYQIDDLQTYMSEKFSLHFPCGAEHPYSYIKLFMETLR